MNADTPRTIAFLYTRCMHVCTFIDFYIVIIIADISKNDFIDVSNTLTFNITSRRKTLCVY